MTVTERIYEAADRALRQDIRQKVYNLGLGTPSSFDCNAAVLRMTSIQSGGIIKIPGDTKIYSSDLIDWLIEQLFTARRDENREIAVTKFMTELKSISERVDELRGFTGAEQAG